MVPKSLIIEVLEIKFAQAFVSSKARGIEYASMRISMHGFVVKVHEFVIAVYYKKKFMFLQLSHGTKSYYNCFGQVIVDMKLHATIFELYIWYGYAIYIIWLYISTPMISCIFL